MNLNEIDRQVICPEAAATRINSTQVGEEQIICDELRVV